MSLPDETEEELFVTLLQLARKGAGPVFDLRQVCTDTNLEASDEQLVAFIVDNDGIYGSKAHLTHSSMRFEMQPSGFRYAKELERQRRTPKIVRSLVGDTSQRLFNVFNSVVALAALAIAIAAYFKGEV